MLRVFSLFSGIGAFEKALTNIGVEYEVVNFCEIDPYAITSYCAIHKTNRYKNIGDISRYKSEWLPKGIDLITYGFPCQDLSLAGKLEGIKEGTRSGLLLEAERIIEYIKPKYAIAENVKNLVSKRFIGDFNLLLDRLGGYGYNNYWQVLNAKDYGIPQNRERVFVVSIRKDIDDGSFEFPKPFNSGLRLKDLLEDCTDEKYFIDNERAERLLINIQEQEGAVVRNKGRDLERVTDTATTLLARDYKGFGNQGMTAVAIPTRIGGLYDKEGGRRHQAGAVWNKESLSPTLDTMQGGHREPLIVEEPVVCEERADEGLRFFKDNACGTDRTIDAGGDKRIIEPKIAVREATKKGYAIAGVGDSINLAYQNSKLRRGRVGKGVANTLESQNNLATLNSDMRIRKLTPLECWRLMGFDDEDYYAAKSKLEFIKYKGKDRTDSQMYKQAGNSIVVNVVEELFKKLFKNDYTNIQNNT